MTIAIGRSTVGWAVLENGIDFLIDTIHERGDSTIQANLPVSLDNKLAYLKKAITQNIVPKARHEQLRDIIAEIQSLKWARHHTIHGIALLDRSGTSFNVYNQRVIHGGRSRETKTYSVRDVLTLAQNALNLFRTVESLHNNIRSDFGLENFEYPFD